MKKTMLAVMCCALIALSISCKKNEAIEPEPINIKAPIKCMGCVRDSLKVDINIHITD